MEIHILQHKQPEEVTAVERIKFQNNYCETCKKYFYKLGAHQKVVHGEVTYAFCEHCGDSVKRLKMREHMETQHTARCVCDLCGKSFRRKVCLFFF